MASSMATSGSRFKFFTRPRGRSPIPNPKKPPPLLTLGPTTQQSRWEAEPNGDIQELSQETVECTSEQTTPLPHVRTAPVTLIVHSPSPVYVQYPQTAGPTDHARFLMSSHPFSANYARQSEQSDGDQPTEMFQEASEENRKRPTPNYRDAKDVRSRPQMPGLSPDPRWREYTIMKHSRTPPAVVDNTNTVPGVEEVDLDVYPWYIYKPESLTDNTDNHPFVCLNYEVPSSTWSSQEFWMPMS